MSGVFTVSQVNNYIKTLFQRDYALTRITVAGEISNCKYHPSGHIYFTLKDAGGSLDCVMFQSRRQGLTIRLCDGQQVEAGGQITVYEKGGKLELIADRIRLSGDGVLFERFLRLKEELAEMGMFDPMYKKPVPRVVRKIGIVTAESGAAIRDICNVAKRRDPYVELVLAPAIVQGEAAAPSIVRALRRLDALGMDVLIVGRGGGSIEDLWAFNEETVARAIFECRTPVISAVGHETDFTIADFVADLRAPTPSAAAELATMDLAAFEGELRGYETMLAGAINRRLSEKKAMLADLQARMSPHSPEAVIGKLRERAGSYEKQMLAHMRSRLQTSRIVEANLREKLSGSMNAVLRERKTELAACSQRLMALSPLRKLSGGYGYVEGEKGAVKSVKDLTPGQMIKITIRDGNILSEVRKIEGNTL